MPRDCDTKCGRHVKLLNSDHQYGVSIRTYITGIIHILHNIKGSSNVMIASTSKIYCDGTIKHYSHVVTSEEMSQIRRSALPTVLQQNMYRINNSIMSKASDVDYIMHQQNSNIYDKSIHYEDIVYRFIGDTTNIKTYDEYITVLERLLQEFS